ncbi:uncharacterized protein BKA78DRAFT_373437 [Phyllosticta capitalensis]|uniref:uncharacterized protein n=1 Tax=Phyllosticta capitalensis TaxID=121624 RepID=UPI003131B0D3
MTVPPPYPSSHAHSSVLQRRRFSRTDALQALHRENYPPAARGGSRGRGRGGAATYARLPGHSWAPAHAHAPGVADNQMHHWPPKRSNVWIAPALASSNSQVAAAAAARSGLPRERLEERIKSRQAGLDGANVAPGQEHQYHHVEVGVKRARRDTLPMPKTPASPSSLPAWEREIETREEAARVHARRGEREKWARNREALDWLRARVAVVKEDEQRRREQSTRRSEDEREDEGEDNESERGESSGESGACDDREEGEWEEIEISDAMRKERDGHRQNEEEAEEALYMYGDAASDVEDLLDYGWGLERSDR